MRVQVEPTRVELADDYRFTVFVTVTNSTEVIGGYEVRVLGADPGWVRLSASALSLFPNTTELVEVTVTLPVGVNAGDRRIAIQVRETTPPHAISVTEIELLVPPREAVGMSLSPSTVTGGRRARFSVITENTGNTPISVAPFGLDPEYKIAFEFTPPVIDLAPGARVITDLRTQAKRPWFGSPVIRPFSLAAVPPDDLATLLQEQREAADAKKHAKSRQRQEERARKRELKEQAREERRRAAEEQRAIREREKSEGRGRGRRRDDDDEETIVDALRAERAAFDAGDTAEYGPWTSSAVDDASGAHPENQPEIQPETYPETQPVDDAMDAQSPRPEPPAPLAQGVMVQRSRLGRGVLSLLSLLLAVSVFAIVITIAFSRLVGVSAADRDLAIQVAQARDASAGVGTSALGGTVALFTDGSPAPGVTVEIFSDGDLTTPMLSTATDEGGAWAATTLPAGSYKLRFRGAGFAEVWYPNALSGAEAESVALDAEQQITDLAVTLGGLPATVSGTVRGADVAGAVLTVEVPTEFLHPVDGSDPAVPLADPSVGGVLRTIPIGSDGAFELTDLPSPAVYDLVVDKLGFAPDRQRIDLAGGESRTGISLTLRTGDGLISGTILGPDGPLGGAVVTAVSGDTSVQTLTLTEGDVGAFTLRGLVTPATYTVTVTAPDFSPVTSTLSLTPQQQLEGVLLSLARATGALSGTVTELATGAPAAGVTVTIASGTDEPLTTVTQSGETAGTWAVSGLPLPGTYTITFSREDLDSQTVAVALDAAGRIAAGGAGETIDVTMRSAFATVGGTVRQRVDGANQPVGEATVVLSSGEKTYTVTTSSLPPGDRGTYFIAGVVPGTYTLATSAKGTSPTTVIISVTAGQNLTYNPLLVEPASVSGVVMSGGAPLPGAEVTMSLASEYPAQAYAQAVTDEQGRYTFPGVDAPQAYVIEVRRADSGPLASESIVLAASQAAVVNFTLSPGGTS